MLIQLELSLSIAFFSWCLSFT